MTFESFESGAPRGRILLVQESSILREITASLLRRSGYEADVCAGSDEALVLVAACARDAVVIDCHRPAFPAADLVTTLRIHLPNAAILVSVSALDHRSEFVLRERGATMTLDRPVNPATLMTRIDRALGRIGPGAAPVQAARRPPAPARAPQPLVPRTAMMPRLASFP